MESLYLSRRPRSLFEALTVIFVATWIFLVFSEFPDAFGQNTRGIWRTQEVRILFSPVQQQDQKPQPNAKQKEVLSSLGMCE